MHKPSFCALLIPAPVLAVVLLACTGVTSSQELDVPYVPTPEPVVERMLQLAQVGMGDYVIDLGSGDGRIVIAAAIKGASGHGVDLDPERVREARENALRSGVSHQVAFLEENIFDTDFSKASVITMYLFPSVNLELRPRLLEQLRPGTRIVSHSFDMDEWEPDAQETVDVNGDTHRIFLWVCPVKMEGRWHWSLEGSSYTMDVSQRFQKVELQIRAGEENFETSRVNLRGRRISFAAEMGNANLVYSGYVEDDRISGIVQIRDRSSQRVASWAAEKERVASGASSQ